MKVSLRQSAFRRPSALRLGAGAAIGLGVLALGSAAGAQMHHVDAPERVTRAIGVYEWTGDLSKPTAARFVPVSLFINGHFEDAGLYLARPIPFAIEPGDVYALEHAGEPEGLLDLDLANRVVTGKALADDDPVGAWYAYGKFTPESAPPAPRLHPTGHLSAIQSSAGPNTPPGTKLPTAGSDDRPHMTRRDGSAPAADGSGSGSGSASDSKSGSGSASGTTTPDSSDDDLDRPTLRRRDPSQDAARRREIGAKGKQASVTAVGPALGDDPDRPFLGRNTAEDNSTPPLTGLPADMHQSVAVSDASHNDAHPFARGWDSPAEKADTLAAMEKLARPLVAEYLARNELMPSNASDASTDAPIDAAAGGQATSPAASVATGMSGEAGAPPKLQRGIPRQYQNAATDAGANNAQGNGSATPAGRPVLRAGHATAGKTAAAKTAPERPAPLTLRQAEVSGFTLSYGGLPTFVYTAAARAARIPAAAKPAAAGNAESGSHPVVYVTVVAQRLPTGELQLAMSSVTDSAHLERAPRLRLIDAVDPDDSHRASLLFEMRGVASRQFALYRLTAVHAEQAFTTASIE